MLASLWKVHTLHIFVISNRDHLFALDTKLGLCDVLEIICAQKSFTKQCCALHKCLFRGVQVQYFCNTFKDIYLLLILIYNVYMHIL